VHGEGMPIVTMAVAVVIVALVAYLSYLASERRKKEWLALATELGCRFAPRDPFGTLSRSNYATFRTGHSRCVYNVMHGTYRGRQMRCFDYRYTVGSGRSSHTYYETLVVVESPMPCAQMLLRPEGFGDRLAAMVGFDDIDFESEEFSKRFYVRCDDKRFAYDVLHQRAMAYLLSCSPLPVIESGAGAFLVGCAGAGQLPIPTGVRTLLETACDFLDMLPAYMLEGGRTHPPS
jgi:hypothetical protein